MRKISLLLFLFTNLTITGFSLFDNALLNQIVAIMGTISYAIVGLLYKLGCIHGRKEGSESFFTFLGALLLVGFLLYLGICNFQNWVHSWHLAAKIIVPIVLGLLFIGSLVLAIRKWLNTDTYEYN